MITEVYRALVNSATGETIQFTAQPQGEDEDVVRFSWRSKPGGEITEHIHPLQEERFNITAGQAHFVLDGETRVLGPGETIIVPAGTRHSEENRGSTEVSGLVELRDRWDSRTSG
jgi:quercetin dioxygenase-like cupin family protein